MYNGSVSILFRLFTVHACRCYRKPKATPASKPLDLPKSTGDMSVLARILGRIPHVPMAHITDFTSYANSYVSRLLTGLPAGDVVVLTDVF